MEFGIGYCNAISAETQSYSVSDYCDNVPEVVLPLDNYAGFQYQVEQSNEIEQLEAASNYKYAEAQISYKGKTIEYSLTINISFANSTLSSPKIFVLGSRGIFFKVQQIDPKIKLLGMQSILAEVQLNPNPFVEGHCKKERQKGYCIQDADQDQPVLGHPATDLVEFIYQFLLLSMQLLSHGLLFINDSIQMIIYIQHHTYANSIYYINALLLILNCSVPLYQYEYQSIRQIQIRQKRMQAKPKSRPNKQAIVQRAPTYQPNLFTRQMELESFIGFKCTHITFFLCWFGLILAGTTIIGFGANNYTLLFDYCAQGEPFCFYDFTLDTNRDLYIYVKLSPFYQNNRMYLDAYSIDQIMGQNGTGKECGTYTTYGKFGMAMTSGGYRVTSGVNVHPCGYPMQSILTDSVYVVFSDGGIPQLDNQIASNYSKTYRFKRLTNYPVSQFTDVEQSSFINWFTIPITSTKYSLMGKLTNLTSGDYRLIVKNNFATKGEFTKQIYISQANSLGITNHLLGFTIFAYGIGMLLVHVGICCKSRD